MEYLKPLTLHEIEQLTTKLAKYTGMIAGNGCQYWQAQRNKYGYGIVNIYYPGSGKKFSLSTGKAILALRLGYWPDRFEFACHTCDNPPCCNPNHIWHGNPKANHDDMKAKGRGMTGKKCKYQTRERKHSDESIAMLKDMLRNGASIKDTAKAMGMTYGYVRDINAGVIKKDSLQCYPILIVNSPNAYNAAYRQGRVK